MKVGGLLQAMCGIEQLGFFEVVADQTGKLFDANVLTIIWARRFAEYKRPDLVTRDIERFKKIVEKKNINFE